MPDGTEIEFDDNCLEIATKIDERNLQECLYMCLDESSITDLNTVYLSALLVLTLAHCNI